MGKCKCGIEFEPKRKKQKFCSLKCAYTGRDTRKLPDIVCGNCDIIFRPRSAGKKFCSQVCAKKRIPLKGVYKPCHSCGTTVYIKKSKLKLGKRHHCSKVCANKSFTKEGGERLCEQCGKEYRVPPSTIRLRGSRFCSLSCRGKHKSITQVGENNPSWKGGISNVSRRIRNGSEFARWRKKVFERDKYICQYCNKRGGYLEPHHIFRFAYFPEFRFLIHNGITLCRSCHQTTKKKDRKFQLCLIN